MKNVNKNNKYSLKLTPYEELRRLIAKYAMLRLKKFRISNFSDEKILNYEHKISEFIYNKVKPRYNNESTKYLKNLIQCIVNFLIKIAQLYETNQLINVSDISKETLDEKLFTLSTWRTYTWRIIQYLIEEIGFSIRTRHHNPFSESKRHSIWSYNIFYNLIDHREISYLCNDYKTELKIYYNGRCQGIDGYCQFEIDYRLMPALSFDHILKNYKKKVRREKYKYIKPKALLRLTLDNALKKMQTQIGGLKLVCKNCHYMSHHSRYRFPAIFNFLKSLNLEIIDKNPSKVLKIVNKLASDYLVHNIRKFKVSDKNPKPTIKYNIKISILKLIKKKYIIEFLFGKEYVCPICQRVNINDHLDLFVAHHPNLELIEKLGKIEFGNMFDRKPIEWLIENLIFQECIFICHNCHTIDLAKNYKDSALTILKDIENARFVIDFYENSECKIKKLKNIILKWKEQLLIGTLDIPDPFPKKPASIFDLEEALDKRLVCIYYTCEIFSKYTKKNFFWGTELSYILNRNISDFYDFKNRLIGLGCIQNKGRLTNWKDIRINKDIYQITDKGIRKANEIIKRKRKIFSNKFESLLSNWLKKYKEYFQNLISE